MIHLKTCSLSNIQKIDLSIYQKKLFIVRSVSEPLKKSLTKYGFIMVPSLSPSVNLYQDYLKWRDKYTNEEWWPLYFKRFFSEIGTRDDLSKSLGLLMKYLEEGNNILISCYCKDYNYCHRKIIGDVISEKYKVIYE